MQNLGQISYQEVFLKSIAKKICLTETSDVDLFPFASMTPVYFQVSILAWVELGVQHNGKHNPPPRMGIDYMTTRPADNRASHCTAVAPTSQ